ncbi:hypothetical protein GQ457_18G018320 [Hibiscus cannabinus]
MLFKWTSFQVCVQAYGKLGAWMKIPCLVMLMSRIVCSVRKDPEGSGFSLSATATNRILKIATSADYGVCKGKRQDGMAYVCSSNATWHLMFHHAVAAC